MNGGGVWMPSAWTRAHCIRPPYFDQILHDSPLEGCRCGIYATKTLATPVVLSRMNEQMIVGRVELAGKVIEHDSGYRAELARVVELYPRPGQESAAEWIAAVYGVRASHALIRMWGSFHHGPPIDPIMRAHRVVHATKPALNPIGPARRRRRHSYSVSAPEPWYVRTGRLGLALGMFVAAHFVGSSTLQPSTTPTVPAGTAGASWPDSYPTICPNTNPLNCYPDLTAMLGQYGVTLPPTDDTVSPLSTTLPAEAPVRPPPS
jgi:hypothetical protein